MATTEHAVKLTYEDYCRAPDDKRYELLNGELMMVPAPNMKHQEILGRLYVELHRFVQEHELEGVRRACRRRSVGHRCRAARRAVHGTAHRRGWTRVDARKGGRQLTGRTAGIAGAAYQRRAVARTSLSRIGA